MAKEDIAARVTELIGEYLASESAEVSELEVYRVQYRKEGKDWILRVFLDKTAEASEEYVSIDECETITRYLNDKLDELDFIDRSYKLEVSSPGLDRELIKDSDFERFAGRIVEVKTYEAIQFAGNNSKNFEGVLIGKTADGVVIAADENGKDEITIPQEKISKINLAVIF
ncbi:MAG: ribosome maturation factor RimP [Clostridiales bacterium]|nr:ribosome maturation factor RimP [Candidatus Crickella caballi]